MNVTPTTLYPISPSLRKHTTMPPIRYPSRSEYQPPLLSVPVAILILIFTTDYPAVQNGQEKPRNMRCRTALRGIPFVQVRLVDILFTLLLSSIPITQVRLAYIVAPLPLSGIPLAQKCMYQVSFNVFG